MFKPTPVPIKKKALEEVKNGLSVIKVRKNAMSALKPFMAG